MKRLIELKHDRDYYWGLTLLGLSCLSLVWALVRDAFKPDTFLVGFILFSCGYAFLWRYDLKGRLAGLETELAELRALVAGQAAGGRAGEPIIWAQEFREAAPDGDEAQQPDTTFLPSEF